MTLEITTPDFKLELTPEVFEGPSPYNADLHVNVESRSFSARIDIDTGTLQLEEFFKQLKKVYDRLSGNAELKGNDGQKIAFEALKTGHIKISGAFSKFGTSEDFKLSFSAEVDQTDLKDFVGKMDQLLRGK